MIDIIKLKRLRPYLSAPVLPTAYSEALSYGDVQAKICGTVDAVIEVIEKIESGEIMVGHAERAEADGEGRNFAEIYLNLDNIDTELSNDSPYPVQNKVITAYLLNIGSIDNPVDYATHAEKDNNDNVITETYVRKDEEVPLASKAVADQFGNVIDTSYVNKNQIDDALNVSSHNPIENSAVAQRFLEYENGTRAVGTAHVAEYDENGDNIADHFAALQNQVDAIPITIIDNQLDVNSENPVANGTLTAILSEIQARLQISSISVATGNQNATVTVDIGGSTYSKNGANVYFEITTTGVATVTMAYGNVTYSQQVSIPEVGTIISLDWKIPASIAVTNPPLKTTYLAGEYFQSNGMQITATYADGTTGIVNGWTYTPTTALTVGQNTITVSYAKLGYTFSTTYNVTAVSALASIAVTTAPTKLVYNVGEQFNSAGMVITATYEDGSSHQVLGWTYSPTGALGLGNTTITVTYEEMGITKSTTVLIEVYKVLTGISITTNPDQTTYNYGDNFDPTGMVITASFNDGSSQPVSDYTYSPTSPLTLQNTSVIVSYTYRGVTQTTTLLITVYDVLNALAVTTPPTITTYTEGDLISMSGSIVRASFASGATSVLASDEYTFSPTVAAMGQTAITVSYTYRGVTLTATTPITVVAAGFVGTASTTPTSGVTYTHNINSMGYELLEHCAHAISDNSSITNTTQTVYIDSNQGNWEIDIGDTLAITVNGYAANVKVASFNTETLSNTAAYGGANTYAGITFTSEDAWFSTASAATSDSGYKLAYTSRPANQSNLVAKFNTNTYSIPSDLYSLVKSVKRCFGMLKTDSSSHSSTKVGLGITDVKMMLMNVYELATRGYRANVYDRAYGTALTDEELYMRKCGLSQIENKQANAYSVLNIYNGGTTYTSYGVTTAANTCITINGYRKNDETAEYEDGCFVCNGLQGFNFKSENHIYWFRNKSIVGFSI